MPISLRVPPAEYLISGELDELVALIPRHYLILALQVHSASAQTTSGNFARRHLTMYVSDLSGRYCNVLAKEPNDDTHDENQRNQYLPPVLTMLPLLYIRSTVTVYPAFVPFPDNKPSNTMQAVTSIMSTLGLKGKPSTSPSLPYHPLNPLDPAEMTAAASAVDHYLRTQDTVQPFSRLWYKAVTLKEPPKAQLAPYLDSVAEGAQVEKLSRQVDVLVGAKRGKEAATWYGKRAVPCPLEDAPVHSVSP